jgi:predicted Rossmann fold nucleotide-binding protein DprA/Smf involved in DNA uptake
MKIIVAGSRHIKKYALVENVIKDAISRGLVFTELVSGGARGVDTMGETWALKNGVPIKRFPADWEKYGISAGPIRNRLMGDYADALIAIWDGKTAGTKNMIDYAKKKNLIVYLYTINENTEVFNVSISN